VAISESRKSAKSFVAMLGIFLVTIPLSACGMCGEEQISDSHSPNGNYLARAYVRGCGATSSLITHANLGWRWSWFRTSSEGTIEGGEVFDNGCVSKVNFVWKDETSLEIQYERCAPREGNKDPAWRKDSSWGEINISYREIPRQVDN
jgi:hypothetical protein